MVDTSTKNRYELRSSKPRKGTALKEESRNDLMDTLLEKKDDTNLSAGEHDHRIVSLGIPAQEITPKVSLAVTTLVEKIDDLAAELTRTREQLNDMEQLVDVDYLAPIPNRRAFMRRLIWAISMRERYDFPVSVLYFDLNNLKSINDTLGHAAGDAAIRHVASTLSSATRDSDFIARIGGDEFAVILFHSDLTNASKRATSITAKLGRTPFEWSGKEIKLSAACGVYSVQPGDSPESAISAADTAMYLDKKQSKKAVLESIN